MSNVSPRYIHGGAWRDPLITSKSITSAVAHLQPKGTSIAGLASINYRLSAYPSTGQSISSARAAGGVKHPTHLEDVMTAISWLQNQYGFKENYVLVGHSCGATLAFQTVMGISAPRSAKSADQSELYLPLAVVGVEGIYDLKMLLENHAEHPIYREFIEEAFGPDRSEWAKASPTSGRFAKTWPNGRVAVLAHSKDDGLVDWSQTETMSDRLWAEKRKGRRDIVISLTGQHDEIWEHGQELAKAIIIAFQILEGHAR